VLKGKSDSISFKSRKLGKAIKTKIPIGIKVQVTSRVVDSILIKVEFLFKKMK
jgi:hypothetical protein